MLKIYLDNCCYNRPFDDLKQEKINLESKAVENILGKHIKKEIEIYGSMAIEFEQSKIKDGNKKRQVEDLYDSMVLKDIEYTSKIKQRTIQIKSYNIKDMDALHIAFAESIQADYMVTTDKKLLNASKRANLKVTLISPIEFIMEVI